jgi:hypothetical protein
MIVLLRFITALWLLALLLTPGEAAGYKIAVAVVGSANAVIMSCPEHDTCSARLPIEVDGKPEDLAIIATVNAGNAYLRFRAAGEPLLSGASEYAQVSLSQVGRGAMTVELFARLEWTYKDSGLTLYPVWRSAFPPLTAVRISVLKQE